MIEENGKKLIRNRMRHINIRYFFVKNIVNSGDVVIAHSLTDDMWGDFFTKTLQGSKFRRFRSVILLN